MALTIIARLALSPSTPARQTACPLRASGVDRSARPSKRACHAHQCRSVPSRFQSTSPSTTRNRHAHCSCLRTRWATKLSAGRFVLVSVEGLQRCPRSEQPRRERTRTVCRDYPSAVSINRFEPNGQTDWVSDRHRQQCLACVLAIGLQRLRRWPRGRLCRKADPFTKVRLVSQHRRERDLRRGYG